MRRFLTLLLGLAGLALALAGGVLAVRDRAAALGDVWYGLDPGSLNLLQAVTQRYLSPDLWDGAAVPLLLAPAWIVLLLPGLVLLALGLFAARRR